MNQEEMVATAKRRKWDLEADVVVVGSGGGALCCAMRAHDHGLKVIVLEKTEKIGGVTAISGGSAWVPGNHLMKAQGLEDSREEALAYYRRLADGHSDEETLGAYIDNAPLMLSYLDEKTPAKWELRTWIPDHHPDFPGAKGKGRSVSAVMYNKNELGPWADKLRRPWGLSWRRNGPLGTPPLLTSDEVTQYGIRKSPSNIPTELVKRREAEGTVAWGNALIARLMKGCLDRRIPLVLNTRALRLIQEGRAVVGVEASQGERKKEVSVHARHGILLACGGFDRSDELRRQFLSGRVTHPLAPPFNEGDGLRMVMDVGAALTNMGEVWGMPAIEVPGETYDGDRLYRYFVEERFWPHSIMVNRLGRRFANECLSYVDMVRAMNNVDLQHYSIINQPAWIIFDANYRSKYPFVKVLPKDPDPDWLTKDETLTSLAQKVGIDPQGLLKTAERFNGFAARGVDEEFARGVSALDIALGDPDHKPNPVLGPVVKPPFYAFPVYAGILGTKGGPQLNARAQVLDVWGDAILGLYAAGNTAGQRGPGYAGAGHSIGEGLTWGFIAANAMAQAAGKAASRS